jgi:integrase
MAYITKAKNGWRVQIEKAGVRKSATFPHKATATAWAAQEEAAILAGKSGKFPARTVADAFDRYEREVSKGKRGAREEGLRLAAIARDFPELVGKVISEVKTPDLVAWRDARLKAVSKGTVQRDINLLRNVWTVARKEWLWCGDSPWTALRMPGDNPARTQRVHWQEIRRIVRWLGYRTGVAPTTKYQEVAWAFLIGLRTALRAGEIMGLTREAIDLERRVVTLGTHKTLETVGVRHVPLTRHGARLLGLLCKREPLWTIGSQSLDVLFRKARDACMLSHLHFHDSRAEALTLLSRKMDVLVLARISGHRDLRVLLDTYYRESAEAIAKRL